MISCSAQGRSPHPTHCQRAGGWLWPRSADIAVTLPLDPAPPRRHAVGSATAFTALSTTALSTGRPKPMIVDFHHHFTPRSLMKEDPGDRLILTYDENGAPSYTTHKLLFEMEARMAMMDACGIDLAMLSSASGMAADLERSRLVNDAAKQIEQDHPDRFIGLAHVNPLGGQRAMHELARCADELGFPGVTITSEQNGLYLDAPDYEPFWRECAARGMFVFVHPALKLNESKQFNAYDLARSTGREFSLVLATIRLINAQVFDRHPDLMVHMSHLAGGIASILGRLRSYQDKTFWGTAGNPVHGRVPGRDFDHYLRHNMVFDTGGFCGEIGSVKTALVEIPADRIVFGTDWPQEIRSTAVTRTFVNELSGLGSDGDQILRRTAAALLKDRLPSLNRIAGAASHRV